MVNVLTVMLKIKSAHHDYHDFLHTNNYGLEKQMIQFYMKTRYHLIMSNEMIEFRKGQ